MNRLFLSLPLALVLAVAAAPAHSDVTDPALPRQLEGDSPVRVLWDDPAGFSDLRHSGNRHEAARGDWVREIARHIRERGERDLPAGAQLEVTVHDIRRAGIYEPWHGPQMDRVRVIKDQYPPRIDLEFTLRGADGTVLAEGPRELRDMGFMNRAGAALGSDPLRYEKRLIDDWLRRELLPAPAAD